VSIENSRCRLPSALATLGSPQLMVAVALRPSPCKVPLSLLPQFQTKGPLSPLSPELERRGDGDIVAEGEDDPDEHAREGGGEGGPGSASKGASLQVYCF
jgi:hypothetical protein